MMLSEQTSVPLALLPLQGLKDHLRLGTGFGDESMQDGLIAAHLRAAIAAIELRTGKALLSRRFLLQLNRWRTVEGGHGLPLAPVSLIVSMSVLDAARVPTLIEADRYTLVPDLARPRVRGAGTGLPMIPEGGLVEIVFEAGFGTDWSLVPSDLAQAVLLLAAEFYEQRHSGGQSGPALPAAVQGLIERWRTVRVLGGGCA